MEIVRECQNEGRDIIIELQGWMETSVCPSVRLSHLSLKFDLMFEYNDLTPLPFNEEVFWYQVLLLSCFLRTRGRGL